MVIIPKIDTAFAKLTRINNSNGIFLITNGFRYKIRAKYFLLGEGQAHMNKLLISMYHYTRDLKHSRYPEIKGLDAELFRKQMEF